MKRSIPIRSYVILGIYSLMVAAFYKWEASLFVLTAALFVEMLLLFIGSFFTHTNEEEPAHVIDINGASFALLASMGLVLPMAKILAERFDEFDPVVTGYPNPILHYTWQILIMALCLGIGYLVDFKQLKATERKHFVSYEVYRVCFLLFGVTLVGLMCEEWLKETHESLYDAHGKPVDPFTPENKMLPIIGMVCARMAIEIWYVRKVIQRSA